MFIKTSLFAAASAAFSAGDYEAALTLLKADCPPARVERANFMRAVAAYHTLDRKVAEEAARDVVDAFRPPQKRHRVVCQMILDDLSSWEEKGLAATGRRMKEVVGRLGVAKGGAGTQARQKRILDDLDRNIRDLEDADRKRADAQAQAQAPGRPIGPNDRPSAPPEGGEGKLDEKKLKQMAEVWGTLPPAERAKVVQEYTRELPPKYKPLIEAYLRNLNRSR